MARWSHWSLGCSVKAACLVSLAQSGSVAAQTTSSALNDFGHAGTPTHSAIVTDVRRLQAVFPVTPPPPPLPPLSRTSCLACAHTFGMQNLRKQYDDTPRFGRDRMLPDDRFTARHRTLDTLQEGIVITGPRCSIQSSIAAARR